MLNKTLKKVMAGILTASMVLGTMVMPAMAAEVDPTPTPLPGGITNAEDTPLTFTTTQGAAQVFTLYVTGLSADYKRIPLTNTQAEDVTWEYDMGSYENQTASGITYTDDGAVTVDGECYAKATVTVPNTAPYGIALIQANLDGYADGSIDFAFVVNPTLPALSNATDVTCEFVVNGETISTYTGLSLRGNINYLDAKYPNPYALIQMIPNLTDSAHSGEIVKEVTVGTGDDAGMIKSIEIGNQTYPINPEDEEPDGYWLYSVIRAGSTMVDPLSEEAGASVYELKTGDTVIWTYYQE